MGYRRWVFVACFLALVGSAHAQSSLESPADGAALSGLGFISGWKCQSGRITVSIPLLGREERHELTVTSGLSRSDTAGQCNGATDNGFFMQINWNWLGTGEHTVIAYDNGVEFARHTLSVVRLDEEREFVPDLTGECAVSNFPEEGVNAAFAWNTGTQHLELTEVGPDVIVPASTEYDGLWDVSFLVDDGLPGRCSCYDSMGFEARITDGYALLRGSDCETGVEMQLSIAISTHGGLYATWYEVRDDPQGLELPWRTVGSMDGVVVVDETGVDMMGNWLQVNGCRGVWLAEPKP